MGLSGIILIKNIRRFKHQTDCKQKGAMGVPCGVRRYRWSGTWYFNRHDASPERANRVRG